MHLIKPGIYAKEAKMTSETKDRKIWSVPLKQKPKHIPRGKKYYSQRQDITHGENIPCREKYSSRRSIISRKAYETCKNKFYSWKLLFLAELNFPHGNIFTHGNHLYSWK